MLFESGTGLPTRGSGKSSHGQDAHATRTTDNPEIAPTAGWAWMATALAVGIVADRWSCRSSTGCAR